MVGERVAARVPPRSVVSATGLPLTPECQRGIDAGILVAREMFEEITPEGVCFANGHVVHADAILWATGFLAPLNHLAPLHMREPGSGVFIEGTTAVRDPRVELVGYGPSGSTLGATRACRRAARNVLTRLGQRDTLARSTTV